MYVKLFASILTSSVWSESMETRLVWITLLTMADSEGFVRSSPSGLARTANVPLAACRTALRTLEQPDMESSTQEWAGRRIEAIEGGWQIFNYIKYRETVNPKDRRATVATLGYVYYVGLRGHENPIKIGFSKNPWARLSDLKVTNPGLVILALEKGPMELEGQRHQQFADIRLTGEWFKPTKTLLDHIAALAAIIPTERLRVATVAPEAEADAEAEAVEPSAPNGAGAEPRTDEPLALGLPTEDPGKAAHQERQAAVGRLMGVVRTSAYLGKPPRGYDDARDASILRGWLKTGRTEHEIHSAIEGLRAAVDAGTVEWVNAETGGLRPGQAFTLRALRNTKSGDRFTWDVAQDTALRRPAGPMPEQLGAVLRKAVA